MPLYYKESGNPSGRLIIFLHGGGVSSWMWDEQIKYFKNDRCISIDLPGHGKSHHIGEFSISQTAKAVLHIIQSLQTDREIIIIGFSLGAQVTLKLLSDSPNKINYAIINSALVQPQRLTKMFIKPLAYLTYPFMKSERFASLQARSLHIPNRYIKKYYLESSNMSLQTLNQVLLENLSFSIPKRLKHSTAKILVTVGAKERGIMKQSAKDILRETKKSSGVIVSNIAHGLPYIHPKLFNQLVSHWIDEGAVLQNCGIIIKK